MRRCQLLESSNERVPPRGDQPKNWRATNPRTSGHQPENWQAALLFNIDGVLKSGGLLRLQRVGAQRAAPEDELAEVSSSSLPSTCPRSWCSTCCGLCPFSLLPLSSPGWCFLASGSLVRALGFHDSSFPNVMERAVYTCKELYANAVFSGGVGSPGEGDTRKCRVLASPFP